MGLWTDAIIFGLALFAFVLGLSSLIMGFLPQPASTDAIGVMKSKIEFGFFGVSGVVMSALFVYAI